MKKVSLVLAMLVLGGPVSAHAGWQDWLSSLSPAAKNATLNQTPAAGAVKELLTLAVNQATTQLAKPGGYANNAVTQIAMPEKLKMLDSAFRKVGFGQQIDAFKLSMNRAAEKAAPQARDVLIESVSNLSVADAEQIFKGGPTAATDFFSKSSRPELKKLYEPIVRQKMQETSVGQTYQALQDKVKQIPLMSKTTFPQIEPYVVDQSLDGLFKVMAEKEKQVRANPGQVAGDALKKILIKYAPATN
jgi:hypothetical protein